MRFMSRLSLRFTDFAVLKRLVAENMRLFAPHYAIALVLMAVTAAATALSAWLMKDLINKVFLERDAAIMVFICGSVFVLYTAKGLATYEIGRAHV